MARQLFLNRDMSRMTAVPARGIPYLFLTWQRREPPPRPGNRRGDDPGVAEAPGRWV